MFLFGWFQACQASPYTEVGSALTNIHGDAMFNLAV